MSSINRFSIVTTQGQLAELFNVASVLGDEARFKVSPEGVRARIFATDNVQLIDVELAPGDFQAFECPSEVTFGVNLDSTAKAIKNLGKEKDLVELSLDDRYFILAGNNTYRLRLKDVAGKENKPIRYPFTGKVKLSRSRFLEICNALSAIDDSEGAYLYVDSVENGLKFHTQGDSGDVEHVLTASNEKGAEVEMELNDKVVVAYRTKQTLKILSAAKMSDVVTFEFGTNGPMKLSLGKLTYYQGCKADYPAPEAPAQEAEATA